MVQPLWDRSWPRRCACALGIAGAAWHGALAQTQMAARNPLLDLSLEDLAKVEITSVSRRPERLLDAAASVYVISAEDIRRSGASSLAEVLRLAPNLQVARGSASQYAISARGMNTNTGNKLQVLLDGRVLYTPLFSGVFWDVQDTLLEDIERVEVISGPGATLWGANAVNGVINIVTREARREREALASVQAGNRERSAAARYGSAAGEQGAWRAYAKHREYAELPKENGAAARDGWRISQAGLRFDGGPAAQRYTLQGDLYDGDSDQPGSAGRRTLRGANLLARVTRALDGGTSRCPSVSAWTPSTSTCSTASRRCPGTCWCGAGGCASRATASTTLPLPRRPPSLSCPPTRRCASRACMRRTRTRWCPSAGH